MSPDVDSILKLNDFRAMKTYFEVNPGKGTFDKASLDLAIDVVVLQSDDSEHDMAVQLKVDVNRDEEQFASAGFTGSVVIAGFFDTTILKQEHPEDWESLLIYNGVTVLIGTVRTMYAELSAASPVGRIVLPAVNVTQILNHAAAIRGNDPAD
jgi:preprotein translocase subunit SecB